MKKALVGQWIETYDRLVSEPAIRPTIERMLLGLILLGCLTARLWAIAAPALDRTVWKEIDYLQLSSNYWHHGFRFLHPEISWPAEPPRDTAMELPLVPYLAAVLYELLGYNAYTARMITLLAFLLMTYYVYRLAKRQLGARVGLLAALASAVMPLYHTFGHYLFSDPLMIAMSVLAIYHFAEWVDGNGRRDWFLAWFGLALAIALKLEPLYLLLPLGWIAFTKNRWAWQRYKGFTVLVLCALIPSILWYSYAYHLSRASIDVFGVFGGLGGQGHDKFQTISMLSTASWYQTMFRRITSEIMGGMVGSLLCALGLMAGARLRRSGVFHAYLLAILFYFLIVARAQIGSHYRQLAAIPPLSLFVALGTIAIVATAVTLAQWVRQSDQSPRVWGSVGCAFLVLLVPVGKRWQMLPQNPNEPTSPSRWRLAQEIRKQAPPDGRLVVIGEYSINPDGYELSPRIYHYSGLQGWTLQKNQWNLQHIQTLREKGATTFVAIEMSREPESSPFLAEMRSHYKLLYEDDVALVLDLQHPLGVTQ